jgi:hypothetical protein
MLTKVSYPATNVETASARPGQELPFVNVTCPAP